MKKFIPKKFNPKSSMNSESATDSRRYCIPTTDIPIVLPKNFINKNRKNPELGTAIHCKNIVFNTEELTEDKWMLVVEDPKIIEAIKKEFRRFLQHSIWIIIQSAEEIQKIKEQEAKKWEQEEREQQYRWDHGVFNCLDLSTISPTLIVAKYQSIEDFKTGHPQYKGELTEKFKTGDEIWHYNEKVNYPRMNSWASDFFESNLLPQA